MITCRRQLLTATLLFLDSGQAEDGNDNFEADPVSVSVETKMPNKQKYVTATCF